MKNTSQQKCSVCQSPTEAYFNSTALISLALKEFQGLQYGMLGRENRAVVPRVSLALYFSPSEGFLHHVFLKAVGLANTLFPLFPKHQKALSNPSGRTGNIGVP